MREHENSLNTNLNRIQSMKCSNSFTSTTKRTRQGKREIQARTHKHEARYTYLQKSIAKQKKSSNDSIHKTITIIFGAFQEENYSPIEAKTKHEKLWVF